LQLLPTACQKPILRDSPAIAGSSLKLAFDGKLLGCLVTEYWFTTGKKYQKNKMNIDSRVNTVIFCHLSFNVETLCLDVFLEITPSYAIERNKPSSIIDPVNIDLLKSAFNIAYRASG
jgi:hypothetical protein